MSPLKIFLDSDKTFFPGQAVTGRVECHDKEITLEALKLKFKGKAQTSWSESETYWDPFHHTHRLQQVLYNAKEVYFDLSQDLLEESEKDSGLVPKQIYPFSFVLPSNLPSTFQGDRGYIRYTVKVVATRSYKRTHKEKLVLNIVSLLDLNFLPNLRDPVAISVDKTFSCCWRESHPVTLKLTLPATGLVPGQEFAVGAHIANCSNVNVENVQFKIVKRLNFIAKMPALQKKTEVTTLASCLEGGVDAYNRKSWTTVLKIPINKPYPNLMPCEIINIAYTLEVSAIVSAMYSNLDVEIPIRIGNIPLHGVNTKTVAAIPE